MTPTIYQLIGVLVPIFSRPPRLCMLLCSRYQLPPYREPRGQSGGWEVRGGAERGGAGLHQAGNTPRHTSVKVGRAAWTRSPLLQDSLEHFTAERRPCGQAPEVVIPVIQGSSPTSASWKFLTFTSGRTLPMCCPSINPDFRDFRGAARPEEKGHISQIHVNHYK